MRADAGLKWTEWRTEYGTELVSGKHFSYVARETLATWKPAARNILRPYQTQALELVRGELRRGKRKVMLMAPTGSGKTSIATEMVRSAYEKGNPVLFVCDSIELIEQTSARFDAEGIPHGVLQAQHHRTNRNQPVQVASIQTLRNRRTPEFKLCVIDEAHVLYRAHKALFSSVAGESAVFVGLSATPFTKGLGKHFDALVMAETTQGLIDQGYLVGTRVFAPSKPDLSKVKTVRGDYDETQLAQETDKPKLVGDIVEHWFRLAKDRPTIAFAVNVAHSKHIAHEFKSAGIKAEHLDSHTDSVEREKIIRAFKTGEIQVLSSVGILTKGFDYPLASCCIMARPTKSLMLYIQQAGRVLRTADGKSDAIILDHAGNTERLGFITDQLPSELDDGKRKERKTAEREKPLPKKCPSCHYVKESHKCPNCGFAPERQNTVIEEKGTLTEITKKLKTQDKAQLFAELKSVARDRGWSDGRLCNVFRDIAGVWPNKYRDLEPEKPSAETLGMVKHLAIKYAKSIKNRV